MFKKSFEIPASEIMISGMTGVGFFISSGISSGSMSFLSARSCTFTRESSFKESGDRGVNTDWNWSLSILALSFVSVWSWSPIGFIELVSLMDQSFDLVWDPRVWRLSFYDLWGDAFICQLFNAFSEVWPNRSTDLSVWLERNFAW